MQTKPKIVIDLDEVARLAGLGLTQAEICLSLGISERTLYRNKRTESELAEAIKRGKAGAAKIISNVLFNKAADGDLGSIVWWEKTRRGLSDAVKFSGDQNHPLRIKVEPFDYDAAVAQITAGSDEDRTTPGED